MRVTPVLRAYGVPLPKPLSFGLSCYHSALGQFLYFCSNHPPTRAYRRYCAHLLLLSRRLSFAPKRNSVRIYTERYAAPWRLTPLTCIERPGNLSGSLRHYAGQGCSSQKCGHLALASAVNRYRPFSPGLVWRFWLPMRRQRPSRVKVGTLQDNMPVAGSNYGTQASLIAKALKILYLFPLRI